MEDQGRVTVYKQNSRADLLTNLIYVDIFFKAYPKCRNLHIMWNLRD